MNGKFLLDTNIAIAFLIGDESLQRPDGLAQLYILCTAIGELFYGELNSNQIDKNIHRLADFIHVVTRHLLSRMATKISRVGASLRFNSSELPAL